MSQAKSKIMSPSAIKRQHPRLAELIAVALAGGGRWREGGKHFIMALPSGRILVFPSSPSDYRGMLNRVSQVRRALREEGLLK